MREFIADEYSREKGLTDDYNCHPSQLNLYQAPRVKCFACKDAWPLGTQKCVQCGSSLTPQGLEEEFRNEIARDKEYDEPNRKGSHSLRQSLIKPYVDAGVSPELQVAGMAMADSRRGDRKRAVDEVQKRAAKAKAEGHFAPPVPKMKDMSTEQGRAIIADAVAQARAAGGELMAYRTSTDTKQTKTKVQSACQKGFLGHADRWYQDAGYRDSMIAIGIGPNVRIKDVNGRLGVKDAIVDADALYFHQKKLDDFRAEMRLPPLVHYRRNEATNQLE